MSLVSGSMWALVILAVAQYGSGAAIHDPARTLGGTVLLVVGLVFRVIALLQLGGRWRGGRSSTMPSIWSTRAVSALRWSICIIGATRSDSILRAAVT